MRMEEPAGTFTLKEVVKEGAGEVLVIDGKLTCRAVPPLPPGLELKESAVALKMSTRLPVNVALGRPNETVEMTMNLLASGKPAPGGPEVQLKVNTKRTVTVKREQIK